jgi:flagellar M-ring protein FliF
MATATATATSPGPGGATATSATSLAPIPGTALANPSGAAAVPAGQPSGLMRVVSGALPVRVQDVLAQPAVRRALPAIVFLLLALLFWLVYAWMQTTPYRPLMTGLSEADRQAALEALRTADFSPRIDKSTGQLTVPLDRYHEARMYLASQGLPKTGASGLDGLKDQSSMTTSQFMEQVRVNAAIEQELARSIMQIGSVQSARVHLATPKQSVFVRDRTPPKASVVVAPHPGRVVSPSQVQAIVHLVSSSVPYLAPEHVTVVDTVGHLMTETAAELKLGLTSAQTQHKQQLEDLYRTRILQILSPVLGEANVRSQVNLVMDFTQIESTTEDYDARDKGPRTRSEVLSEDRAARRDAAGIPGALSNTPPAEANTTTATASDPAKGKSESSDTVSSRSTRNYELDRNVRHVKNATGVIQRLSVAVVVNERAPAGKPAEGQSEEAPGSGYSAQELERLQELVRGVVGFDNARGDTVTVVPARFEATQPPVESPWYLEDKVHYGLRTGLLGLAFIVFLLVVVRPLMRLITGADDKQAQPVDEATPLADGELSEEEMRMIQIGEGESLEQIKAKLKPKKSLISADMLDTANTYDDKVALIRMLVAEDSGRVASVLKGMIRSSK